MPSDSVRVAVRVRPFNQREKSLKSKCVISMKGNTTIITNPQTNESKSFAFDHSYWSHSGYTTDKSGVLVPDHQAATPYADQEKVFSDLGQSVLDNAWQGYNAALFAYGQTGSGKSYSMLGYGPNKGIVPITCSKLFSALDESKKDSQKEYQVTFSMIEIYNEQVRDLLVESKSQPKGGLRVRQHPQQGFYAEGLKQVPTESYDQIERLMDQGAVNRTTAATVMNATSSRSHMVITITFKQIYKNDLGQSTTKSSRISLVDLAGSERANSTGATGDRLKEGSAINVSLSTLGKVISALADLSMGKAGVIVPYRDSVLTKLLRTALGGNSKTVMIAALSPSHMYYDETLSTLRYADRAKNIKTKAVVNESPTDRLIRELTAEKNKLLDMLKKMQGGEGDSKLEELEHMLEENKRQMADMHLSWEQRMQNARAEWEQSLPVQSPRKENKQSQGGPYLQNINEDPQLSGVVKIPLNKGCTVLGKTMGAAEPNKIDIRGIGIQKKHVILENKTKEMILIPGDGGAEISVNGKRVKKTQPLNHMDRLKLGSNNLYLYIGFPKERSATDDYDTYDYDYILSELADSTGMGRSMLRSISEDVDTQKDPASTVVFQEYIKLLPKVYEANAMSEEMEKNVVFEAQLKNLAGHDDMGRPKQKEITVKVTNRISNKVWMWSREKFRHRKYVIEDIYCRWMDGESAEVESSRDPFWDPVEDIYLGSCHIWLNNVAYCMDSDEYVDVHDHHGRQCGVLHAKTAPCNKRGKVFTDEAILFDPSQLKGKSLNFLVLLPQARDVQWVREDSSRGVYLSFSFYDHPQLIKTNTIKGSVNPNFDYKKHFSISQVGPDLIDYLQTHALVIEMWGTQVEEKAAKLSNGQVPNRRMSIGDPATHELREAVARKDREIARLREERNEAQRELQKLKGETSRTDSVASDSHSLLAVGDKAPSPRRLSDTPHPGSPVEPNSLDGEMAKALKVFFHDVKHVQVKMADVVATGEASLKSAKKGALKESLERHQSVVQEVDTSLDNCVGLLKESMFAVIRRMKQHDQKKS